MSLKGSDVHSIMMGAKNVTSIRQSVPEWVTIFRHDESYSACHSFSHKCRLWGQPGHVPLNSWETIMLSSVIATFPSIFWLPPIFLTSLCQCLQHYFPLQLKESYILPGYSFRIPVFARMDKEA